MLTAEQIEACSRAAHTACDAKGAQTSWTTEFARAVERVTLEAAARAVEQHDRAGREWVPTSFWGTLSNEAAARVRALIPSPAKDTPT